MDRVRFVTFGCKANQYDTQVLREALVRRGWDEVERGAELVVVNTCTVTAEAGRKARQLIRRLARENPAVKVCVTGCLAESEPEVLRELPSVEWVLGNGEAKRPLNFLRDLGLELDPEELGIPAGISAFAGHTRAFVKIQDGCDMSCAFCIIPKVRGASLSRPIPELAEEIARLVRAGHLEVVLCGIHIGHWGRDLGLELADLLRALCALDLCDAKGEPCPWRLRLSSIEATEVEASGQGGGVLEVMAEHPERIACHLHMPLQSGDDEILKAMNRWYDSDQYLAALERIRTRLDRPAFTADVLVGFPGEERRHFENTLRVCEASGFARLHVFPFSARPGTRAAELSPPPPAPEVRERRAALGELASGLARRYRQSLGGTRERVVLEGSSGLCGRYQKVRVDPEHLVGAPEVLDVVLEPRLVGDSGDSEDDSEDGARVELYGLPIETGARALTTQGGLQA